MRYPGGKTRACKLLDTILNEHFNIHSFTKIVSPFFGGGSFEFHIQNKYGIQIIANDKFEPLYHFWNTCKMNKEQLCEELYKKIDNIDKSEFTKFQDERIESEEYRPIIYHTFLERNCQTINNYNTAVLFAANANIDV